MELDEIIYNALTADTQVMSAIGGRIKSTCIEVPPTDEDNTPLPYIIIAEESSQNDQGTKDDVWESDVDIVNVGVIVSATSPKAVKRLRRMVRKAIGSYIESITEDIPYLRSLSWEGISWDWTKTCYYDTLHYQCDMVIKEEENEQED